MNTDLRRPAARLALALSTMTAAPVVLAGGPGVVVTFGPNSLIPVPTLGTAALVVLALLLAVVALRTAKDGKTGRAAAIALCSAGLVTGGVGIERSMATSSFSVTSQGDCETGGSYAILTRGGNIFTNDCPNAMRVLGYEFADPGDTCTLIPNNGEAHPACVIDSPIASGNSCALPICDEV